VATYSGRERWAEGRGTEISAGQTDKAGRMRTRQLLGVAVVAGVWGSDGDGRGLAVAVVGEWVLRTWRSKMKGKVSRG
jgi:hypothetical protein